MNRQRGPRFVPMSLLVELRMALHRDRSEDDPIGYQVAAAVLEAAYAEGYADGWLRGHDEGWTSGRAVSTPAPEQDTPTALEIANAYGDQVGSSDGR